MTDSKTHEGNGTPESKNISLQLYDIVQIDAPDNDALHSKSFIVSYISSDKIKISDTETMEPSTILISEDGNLQEESIIAISLLSRGETDSFAKQNNLVTGTWVDIHFGGDVPEVITGEISNLEEDMIEIKLHPSNDIIYIDFGYKGVPEELNITAINIRSTPDSIIEDIGDDTKGDDTNDDEMKGEASEDDALELYPYQEETTMEVKDRIREFFIDEGEIEFGEELDEIVQEVRISDDKQRFSLTNQTDDLLDDLLSTIPTTSRTKTVMDSLHKMIERYKQLRGIYSEFDDYGNAGMPIVKTADYKPLVEKLRTLNSKLNWIIPVVKTLKPLYDIDEAEYEEYSDIRPVTLAEARYKECEAIDSFYNTASHDSDELNKYTRLLQDLNSLLDNHNPPYSDEELLAINETHHNVVAIVDNLGDHYSSIAKNDNIRRAKFLRESYTMALSKLNTITTTGSSLLASRKAVAPNASLPIKSFLFLPEDAVRYSRINLPTTNILTRANLNTHLFELSAYLNNKTVVNTVGISNFETKIDYENAPFLKGVTEYELDDSVQASDRLDAYLNHIVPRTKDLFDLVKKYISGKLSFNTLLGYLEPFGIYIDGVTYKQYQHMNNFISDKIKLYKQDFAQSYKLYRRLSRPNRYEREYPPTQLTTLLLYNLLSIKPQQVGAAQDAADITNIQQDILEAGYGISNNIKHLSSSELLKQILEIDGSMLYMTGISLTNSHLLSAVNINDTLESADESYKQMVSEETANNECKKYVISKKYRALDELREDDDKAIYFDTKLDPTRYEIMEEYSAERSTMKSNEFKLFIIETLQKNIGLNEEDAIEDAEAMIEGKRIVKDGYYAAVEEEDVPPKYYKRTAGRWVMDESIPGVRVDSNDIFCNMQPKCFSVKQNCIDSDISESTIKHKSLEQILSEFDIKYEVSKEQLLTLLNNRMQYFLSHINGIKRINKYQRYKYNNVHYTEGLQYIETEVESVASPYNALYNLIMGQSDFVKRNTDLFNFCNKFTRVAIDAENPWFRYCIDTSKALVPKFQFELAETWVTSVDKKAYFIKLQQIQKNQGKISDDGDAWVDEHSGRKISSIEYDTEEGFDSEGRKMVSREIIEAELGSASVASEEVKMAEGIDDSNPNTRVCLIVLNAMSKFMGINIDTERQFILSNVELTNARALGSKEDYEKKAALILKKRSKKLPTWDKINNQSLILLTLSYLLVAIQCSVPPIKTRKTFPGCIRSFNGYPIDGSADYSAVEYISCVAAKISSSTAPWDAIKRMGQSSISKQLKNNIDKFIVVNDDIRERFKKKMEWTLINVNDNIPSQLTITTWQQFRPPLKPIELETINNVSSEFKDRFLQHIRTGNPAQREQLGVIKGKILSLSVEFMKKIQKVVKSKQALLTNSVNEPFLENVCCQENVNANALQYFLKEDSTLAATHDMIESLSNIVYDVVQIPKAVTILSIEDTTIVYPPLSDTFNESTIYLGYMKFCNFDNDRPIPSNLLTYCTSKPEDFDKYDSTDEQIRKLKRDGINFTEAGFLGLLKTHNRNNKVVFNIERDEVSEIQKLRDIVEYLKDADDSSIPAILVSKLEVVLDSYSVTITQDTEELQQLTNYLSASNTQMREEISNFFNAHGQFKRSQKKQLSKFIEKFHEFALLREDISVGHYSLIEDESIYRAIAFMKTIITNIIKLYPNVVLNNISSSMDVKIPSYWKLSERHKNTIKKGIMESYRPFSKFENDDALGDLLRRVQTRVSNLFLIMEELVCFSSIIKNKNERHYSLLNRRSVMKLLEYLYLSVVREHIVLVDDTIIQKVKTPREVTETKSSVEVQSELTGELMDELEIVSGDTLDLNRTLAEYLAETLIASINTKKNINYSQQEIKDLVNRAKEREKDDITTKLKDMTDEERNIDTELKKHKLGDWGIGLQKGLTQYVPDFYDKEIEEYEQKQILERQAENLGLTNMGEREAIFNDQDENNRVAAEIDREINDISMLAEDEGQNYEDGDGDEMY